MNQTLVFNTATKSVKVYADTIENSRILFNYDNVPTVGLRDGYYEVMQKDDTDKSTPVLRLPMANTNMVINK
jgi:hypothetical protein